VDGHVTLALYYARKSPAIRERELALACEAAEYRDDVFGRFVHLVHNENASMCDGAKQRGVRVADHAAFKSGLEHELLHGRVAVKLYVLAGPLEKLRE
jgi:hypothetical protein